LAQYSVSPCSLVKAFKPGNKFQVFLKKLYNFLKIDASRQIESHCQWSNKQKVKKYLFLLSVMNEMATLTFEPLIIHPKSELYLLIIFL